MNTLHQSLGKSSAKKENKKIRNSKHFDKKKCNLAFQLCRYSLQGRIRNGRVAHLLV
jgi:hypothetical protein